MYRWVEHTSEVELEIESASEEGVFVEALDALGDLLREQADEEGEAAPAPERVERELSVAAEGRERLLAAWLGELAFLAESEGLVPERVTRIRVGDGIVHAHIEGHAGAPPHLVKAVTYHRLAFERDGERWRARAILDV